MKRGRNVSIKRNYKLWLQNYHNLLEELLMSAKNKQKIAGNILR